MPLARGSILKCTASFEKVAQAIGAFGPNPFTKRDVTNLLPFIPESTIGQFLVVRTRSGELERLSRGKYQTRREFVRRRLPSAFIIEKIWEVLREATEPLDLVSIVIRVEEKSGDHSLDLYRSTSVNLSRWTKAGVLERSGRRTLFKYRLRQGIETRPPVTDG